MEIASSSWVGVVRLVISFRTIILARRVLIINNKNTDLDRRVHAVDKRQGWINVLRHLVFEILAQLKILVSEDLMPIDGNNREAQSINYIFGKIKLRLSPDEPD